MSPRFGDRFEPFVPLDFLIALLASAAFGYAIAFNWGAGAPRAFQPVVVGGVLVLWRLIANARQRHTAAISGEAVWLPLLLLFFAMAWSAFEDQILLYASRPWPVGRNCQAALVLVVLSYLPGVLGLREPSWAGHLRFAVVTLLVVVIGVDVIKASPHPRIDVWDMQQGATEILMRGQNPYRDFVVRDSYNGAATIPFVYPPTVLYLGAIAKKLGEDVRYLNLLVIVMTGLGLRSISRRAGTRLPALGIDAAALVFLLQPKLFFVLEQAWIDAFQLGFLVAGFAVYLGRWRSLGVVLIGIALSSKQTMFWLAPLIWLFWRFSRRDWIVLAVTMAALLLPFVVWDWRALKAATVDYHAGLSPRRDALGFMAWWWDKHHVWRSTAPVAWAGCFGVLALGFWRLRGRRVAFGLAVTAIYFLFFFFQKWAFANYYFLIDGFAALAAALAIGAGSDESAQPTSQIATAMAPASTNTLPPTMNQE